MPKDDPYEMSPFPLYLQGRSTAEDDKNAYELGVVDRISVSTPEVEAAYGKAAIASIRLHHVLTDIAVAITEIDVEKLLTKPSGVIRNYFLTASEASQYADLRPYLLGWDHYLGQQSIKYRNHVVHAHLWNQGGRDIVGRIEDGRYTELTPRLLNMLAARIHYSFQLLNQIFWDVLYKDYAGAGLVRTSHVHHFHARQASFSSDIRGMLPFLESKIPSAPIDTLEGISA